MSSLSCRHVCRSPLSRFLSGTSLLRFSGGPAGNRTRVWLRLRNAVYWCSPSFRTVSSLLQSSAQLTALRARLRYGQRTAWMMRMQSPQTPCWLTPPPGSARPRGPRTRRRCCSLRCRLWLLSCFTSLPKMTSGCVSTSVPSMPFGPVVLRRRSYQTQPAPGRMSCFSGGSCWERCCRSTSSRFFTISFVSVAPRNAGFGANTPT